MLTAASWAENIFVGSRDDETMSGTGRLQGSLLTMFFWGALILEEDDLPTGSYCSARRVGSAVQGFSLLLDF